MDIFFERKSKPIFLQLSVILLLFLFSVSSAQVISFSDDSGLATGYLPYDLVCEDFNGDGMADIAFTNINQQLSDPVQIHLNDGFGNILSEADSLYPNIDDPKAIAAGDLNNDQITDLAYVIYADSSLGFLLGTGDGKFTRGTDLKISSKPQKVVIADFNKDMNNDLAVASHSNLLFIFYGNGQAAFGEPVILNGAGSVQDLEVADMNKDGYSDLLVGTGNLRSVVMYINDGNEFTKDNVHTYRTSWHIKSADFNNDGYEDIIAGSGSYDFDNVYVLLGSETGEYICPDTLSPASYIDDIIVADFNQDSKTDVLIADRHGLYLMSGNGDGHFSSVDTIDFNYGEYQSNAAEAVDMDNDGMMDIVVACDQHISVYYNTTELTSIDSKVQPPVRFTLKQNYPNPFNPITRISYQISQAGHVKLTVYNILGQQLKILVDEFQTAGNHVFTLDASQFSSGVYFYQLKTNTNSLFRKMQIVK